MIKPSPLSDLNGVPNSYVSRAEFKNWVKLRGLDAIASADGGSLDDALVKATDYMQQTYRLFWKGSRIDADQALDWPRRGVDIPDFFDPFRSGVQAHVPVSFQDTHFVGEDEIPLQVKQCQMFLAISIFDTSTDPATVSLERLQANFSRATIREKVGSLEVQYASDGALTEDQRTAYYEANTVIAPFLSPTEPHTGRRVRA